MPLMTDYQDSVFQSLKGYDFERIFRMKGRCHDALIGEWIKWWLSQNLHNMICNPARSSKSGSRTYIADLLFLEQFEGNDYYDVKGVAEVENDEKKFMDKIESLRSYEKYFKLGSRAYPNLSFAILCYTLNIPNDDLAQKVYDKILKASENSNLLWIACEIGNSLRENAEPDYSIFMPNYVKGAERFFYYRNFSSVILYGSKKGEQIGDIIAPGKKE